MNAVIKLIIGLLVLLAGLAWYWYGDAFIPYIGMTSVTALLLMIAGSVGIFLILFGFLVVWIEMEEIKDMRSEKKCIEKPMPKPVAQKPKRPVRRKR